MDNFFCYYYMAESTSGQDENPDWLPERARGTKLVLSRWLNISLILFCAFIDLDVVSVNKNAKELANIQPY